MKYLDIINLLNQKDAQTRKIKEYINEYIKDCNKYIKETDYLTKRKITAESLINYFYIGFDKIDNSLILPSGKNLETFNKRQINQQSQNRYFKLKKTDEYKYFNVFNMEVLEQLKNNDIVFITEGIFDSLSLFQALIKGNYFFYKGFLYKDEKATKEEDSQRITSLALNGTNGQELKKILEEEQKKKGEIKAKFIISLDNDEAGNSNKIELFEELEQLKINSYFFLFGNYESENKIKDFNEFLIKDDILFLERIEQNLKETESQIKEKEQQEEEEFLNKISFLSTIERVLNAPQDKPLATRYKNLNILFNGGISNYLYILGGEASVGKTTFLINLASSLVKDGYFIIYYSLEMTENQIIYKLLSDLSFYKAEELKTEQPLDFALTAQDFKYNTYLTVDKLKIKEQAINELKEKFTYFNLQPRATKEKENFFSLGRTTPNKIKDDILDYQKRNKKVIIFVDYLQILQTEQPTQTDKEKTDYLMTELANIKKVFNCPIFAISSLNRESYKNSKNGISLASFNGSGSIEYTADLALALEFDTTEQNQINSQKPRESQARKQERKEEERKKEKSIIKLKVLKNREGNLGEAKFIFYKKFNHYEEF